MSELPTVKEIRERSAVLRERITTAGGDADRIRVVAVTKAFPPALIPRALAAGLIDLGENYGQELRAKADWLAGDGDGADDEGRPPPRWHFIGGLQRNKVKQVASLVHLWHSVDRTSLADEIAKRAPGARILVQVNTTGEGAKSGCSPEEAPALVERAREAGLDVLGLMTVGPTDTGVDPRPAFAALASLAAELGLVELSMGMSGDLEAAVAEGATMIRVGTSLFGPRRPPSVGAPGEPPPGAGAVRN